MLSSESTHPCVAHTRARGTLRVYLVDPGDDCVLGVVRQLLDMPVAVRGLRVSVDAGHHTLHAHHLHRVRHHQCVYERQVGTLSTHGILGDYFHNF